MRDLAIYNKFVL